MRAVRGLPLRLFAYLGEVTFRLGHILAALRPPIYLHEWFRLTARLAVKCFWPVMLVLGAFGAVISIQGLFILRLFTVEQFLGGLLTASFQKELAPVLAGVIVAVQGGSFLSAELGAMRLREQIDALEVMSVDPARYLLVPRLMATVVVTPILALLGGAFAVAVGSLVAIRLYGVTTGAVLGDLFVWLDMKDALWGLLLKATLFGGIVGLLANHHGMKVSGSALEVGKAANRTVVNAILLIFLLNTVLTNALFGGRGG